MNLTEIDYRDLTDDQIEGLISAAQQSGGAAILQKPVETDVDNVLSQEEGEWTEPIDSTLETAQSNFETIVENLEAINADCIVIESRSSGEREQMNGFESILLAILTIPLILFLLIGYSLQKIDREQLRRDLLDAIAIGPAGRIMESAYRVRQKAERESTALKRSTGVEPLVVVQRGTIR